MSKRSSPELLIEDIIKSAEKIHRIRGFRNRIVHDYAGIDNSIVWSIIEEFVPIIIDSLKTIGK